MRGLYQFEVNVERAPGKFWRSRTVTVKPRMVLVNNAQRNLLCCQRECATDIELGVGEQRPWHWPDSTRAFLLAVCFAEQGWNWSAGFAIQPNHKVTIKVRRKRVALCARTHSHVFCHLDLRLAISRAKPRCSRCVP
jgi:hypothetical protein